MGEGRAVKRLGAIADKVIDLEDEYAEYTLDEIFNGKVSPARRRRRCAVLTAPAGR